MNTQSLRRNASAALFALGAEQQSSWLLAPLFAMVGHEAHTCATDGLDCVNNSLCKRAGWRVATDLIAMVGGVPTASIVEITAFANAPGRQLVTISTF